MISRRGFVVAALMAGSAFGDGVWDASVGDFPRLAGEAGDSARIMRAVEAAGAGGVVWVPRGEYEIDSTIVVSNRSSLLMHKSAHLKAVKEIPFVLRYYGRAISPGVYDHNLFIRGGDIDGAGIASCAYVMGVVHFTMADATFRNGRKVGLQVGEPYGPSGYEFIANNLYFKCDVPGCAGNIGLLAHIGDSHFTDIVVVDYTIGISNRRGGANRYTRCHVWGGPVNKTGTKEPEYLPGSIAFEMRASDIYLDTCYADTAMTGFYLRGDARLRNCSYFNNFAFKMDNPTVFHHELGSLSVTGGRYSKNSPHSTLYVRGAEAGNLLWFDNRVTGFTAEETKTLDDTLK